ncbi:MAG: tetratricopeptide repeat protein [Gemmatimonadaceae bacterium]
MAEGQPIGFVFLNGFDRFVLAELLYARGRFDEALGWYESIADISFQQLPYLGPAELRQAEIHERRGDRARAIRHYKQFVSLWKDCDPELRPLVTDAERRLARLNGAG